MEHSSAYLLVTFSIFTSKKSSLHSPNLTMQLSHLLAGIGLVFLAGCASQPRVVVVHEPNPEQPPTHIPLQSEANVIIPGQTKAYPVARYVDPSNPRIMHERHVI